jgi:hypothetical protein
VVFHAERGRKIWPKRKVYWLKYTLIVHK